MRSAHLRRWYSRLLHSRLRCKLDGGASRRLKLRLLWTSSESKQANSQRDYRNGAGNGNGVVACRGRGATRGSNNGQYSRAERYKAFNLKRAGDASHDVASIVLAVVGHLRERESQRRRSAVATLTGQ